MGKKNVTAARSCFTPPYDKKTAIIVTKFLNKTTSLALASLALLMTGCANDEFTGDKGQDKNLQPIVLDMQTSMLTRATEGGSTAAGKLGNEFIVWGEKNEIDGATASAENLVFKNYRVQYADNTANTTLSNTKNWEYVGIAPYEAAKVSPSIYVDATTKQTIKYWDYAATSYTFTAVSAKKDDLADGKVVITKTQTGNTKYDKGYTIALKEGASAADIYVADRNVIAKGTGTDRTATNAYGGNATFTFRNFQTKIRFGMYEVIPGYNVQVKSVKFNNAASSTNFGVDGSFVTAGANTTYTVSYEDGQNGTTENKAKVAVSGTPNTTAYLQAGANMFGKNLGTDAKTCTYDTANGAYTAILPNPSNATAMTFTISYDLIAEDGGEKISVTNKTAVVPAQYCQWKNNFAYTYLFKITDNAAELYPITFDAVVETNETGAHETQTFVDEPSITTFAVTSAGKIVTDKDEYAGGNTIYASVVEGGAVVALTDTNVKLYTVTTTDATTFPITAASVANAIEHNTTKEIVATEVTTGTEKVTAVPDEYGAASARTISALKWTATANTVYAVEYTSAKGDKKTYGIVKVGAAE